MIKNILIAGGLSLITLTSANAVTELNYTESIDGDLGAPTTPTFLTLGLGSNSLTGQVDTANADTRDAFAFTLTAGQTLESIILVSYDNPLTTALNDGNTGFFHLDDGLVSVIPDVTTSSSLLTGNTFNSNDVGSNFLDAGNITGGPGISDGELGPGSYTFNIQNTSTISSYELQFNIIPEPSTASLLGFAAIFLTTRRRR